MKNSRFQLRPTPRRGFLSLTFHAARPGDPRSYILKVGPDIPARQAWARELQPFSRELAAYQLLAPFQGKLTPRLFCGLTSADGSDGLLLLQEIRSARSVDQLHGLSWKQLTSAVRRLAQIHAHFWNSPALRKTPGLPPHRYMRAHQVRRYLPAFLRWAKLSPPHRALFLQLPAQVASALAHFRSGPTTLIHGDLRADNIFFGLKSVHFIDWGLASTGHALFDLARLAGASARPPLTSAEHSTLLNLWHRALLSAGVRRYSASQAWSDYRAASLLTLTIPVTNAPTLARFSPRGQKLARLITQRFILSARRLGLGPGS